MRLVHHIATHSRIDERRSRAACFFLDVPALSAGLLPALRQQLLRACACEGIAGFYDAFELSVNLYYGDRRPKTQTLCLSEMWSDYNAIMQQECKNYSCYCGKE